MKFKFYVPSVGVLGLLLTFAAAASAQSTAAQHNSFAVGPNMNVARYDAATTKLPSGNLLLAGGGGSSSFLDTLEIYRYRTNDFVPGSALPSMTSLRANETATLLPNGKVLIAGGAVDIATWTATTDIFNPVSRTITAGPDLNDAREGATAKLLKNGRVIIAGGRDGLGTLNSVDIYHPVGNKITAGPPMNVARYDCAAVVLPNGNLMLFGGFGAITQSQPLKSTEIYNPTTKKWAVSPPDMLHARGGARATLLDNGTVLITGGTNAIGVLATTEIYHPATRTFTAGPDMNSPRKFHTQIRLPGGRVLIAGGYSDNTGLTALDTTDIYHPVTHKITAGPVMSDSRGLASGALFANGKAIIAGGTNGLLVLDTSERYTP